MLNTITRLKDQISRVFLGHTDVVDRLLCCMFARGHILIEDVPGVGKTLLAATLARSIDCRFSRIQLTPDMLPADVLGVSVFDQNTGRFDFKQGPIFANIILADEINRTTPRTQTALLEAMSEQTVSIDGQVWPLEPPFMIVATQNPYTFEGTYPLPESQLDRFLMRISIGYPTPEHEARVLQIRPADTVLKDIQPVLTHDDVMQVQQAVDEVKVDRSLIDYVIALSTATREHPDLTLGLSPRGSLALVQAAKSSAVIAARDYVIPEDIYQNFMVVAGHRVFGQSVFESNQQRAVHDILQSVQDQVPSPA